MLTNHPQQQFLFFVAQDFDDDLTEDVRQLVDELGSLRDWVISPPQFIDECSESELGTPIKTLGGALMIYSALPPNELPRDIDVRHLEEVEMIIRKISDFSKEHELAIEFNLDGKFVGAVEDGNADRTLGQGLVGEWKRHLGINRM
jgi:hypothetical protein